MFDFVMDVLRAIPKEIQVLDSSFQHTKANKNIIKTLEKMIQVSLVLLN